MLEPVEPSLLHHPKPSSLAPWAVLGPVETSLLHHPEPSSFAPWTVLGPVETSLLQSPESFSLESWAVFCHEQSSTRPPSPLDELLLRNQHWRSHPCWAGPAQEAELVQRQQEAPPLERVQTQEWTEQAPDHPVRRRASWLQQRQRLVLKSIGQLH